MYFPAYACIAAGSTTIRCTFHLWFAPSLPGSLVLAPFLLSGPPSSGHPSISLICLISLSHLSISSPLQHGKRTGKCGMTGNGGNGNENDNSMAKMAAAMAAGNAWQPWQARGRRRRQRHKKHDISIFVSRELGDLGGLVTAAASPASLPYLSLPALSLPLLSPPLPPSSLSLLYLVLHLQPCSTFVAAAAYL